MKWFEYINMSALNLNERGKNELKMHQMNKSRIEK